ncbi:MAG: hypothetical protein R2773_03120 [Flavobacteriaceae bacterium]
MKTDLYTKTILTLIAVCLAVIALRPFEIIPTVQAHSDAPLNETASQYRLISIDELETLDVRIVDISTYDELNVNVKSIDTSDELDVNIDEIGGSWVSSGSPIPVTIKQ